MVSKIRAVFCDDDTSMEFRDDWPVPPNIIVNTSPNKFQYYWLTKIKVYTKDGKHPDTGRYEILQQFIVNNYSGDNQAKDIARILRLPGFFHQKRDPFLVRAAIHHADVYDFSDLFDSFIPEDQREMPPVDEDDPCNVPKNESFDTDTSKYTEGYTYKEDEKLLRSGEHIHGPCTRIAMSFANFHQEDYQTIYNRIMPALRESAAKNPSHPNHPEWLRKINGDIEHDILTAIHKAAS